MDAWDPYSFNQGERSGPQPKWDPFDFNQGTDRNLPKPPQPNFPRPDSPQPPRPDVPIPPKPDVPLPPMPDSHSPHEIRLPDGARNVTDDQGRVILTASADGSKTREVLYGDSADPTKVMQVTIDHDRTYTRNPDGRSWSYSVNGQPSGTWYGDVHMSAKGDYSFEDDSTGEKRKFAPNTSEISDPSQTRPQPNDGGGCNQYYPQRNDGGCNQYYPRPYDGGGCNQYYQQPISQSGYYHHNRPVRGGYYNQANYSEGSCQPGYANGGPYGARFGGGGQFLAGMAAGYGMPRYYGYPGYGGGAFAGALVGGIIRNAIFGHRRW